MKNFASTILILISMPAFADPYSRNDQLSSKDQSKGVSVYDANNNAQVRMGVSCSLVINKPSLKVNYEGLCNVGRRGSVSIIYVGEHVYKIIRDSPNEGRLYRGENSELFISTVYPVQNCWVFMEDTYTKFCAK